MKKNVKKLFLISSALFVVTSCGNKEISEEKAYDVAQNMSMHQSEESFSMPDIITLSQNVVGKAYDDQNVQQYVSEQSLIMSLDLKNNTFYYYDSTKNGTSDATYSKLWAYQNNENELIFAFDDGTYRTYSSFTAGESGFLSEMEDTIESMIELAKSTDLLNLDQYKEKLIDYEIVNDANPVIKTTYKSKKEGYLTINQVVNEKNDETNAQGEIKTTICFENYLLKQENSKSEHTYFEDGEKIILKTSISIDLNYQKSLFEAPNLQLFTKI